MAVKYLREEKITDRRTSTPPRSGQTVSGYGSSIPSHQEVKIEGRWHRVYVMQYGNAGSAYVKSRGRDLFLR